MRITFPRLSRVSWINRYVYILYLIFFSYISLSLTSHSFRFFSHLAKLTGWSLMNFVFEIIKIDRNWRENNLAYFFERIHATLLTSEISRGGSMEEES